MNKSVRITFQPAIWKDEHLNNASQGIGITTCLVSGETREQLFENIRHKIQAMSSEACIHNEEVTAEYNRWISDSNKTVNVPTEITNMGQRDMYFALPYSSTFKKCVVKKRQLE
jgi:hypothetical protein